MSRSDKSEFEEKCKEIFPTKRIKYEFGELEVLSVAVDDGVCLVAFCENLRFFDLDAAARRIYTCSPPINRARSLTALRLHDRAEFCSFLLYKGERGTDSDVYRAIRRIEEAYLSKSANILD